MQMTPFARFSSLFSIRYGYWKWEDDNSLYLHWRCINGNNDACSTQSSVAWSSNAGQLYSIMVHGRGAASGSFLLQIITDGDVLAASDFCSNADPVQLNEDIPIDLSQATEDGDVRSSSYNLSSPKNLVGNLYKVVGTGGSLIAFLFSDNEFDLCFTGMVIF